MLAGYKLIVPLPFPEAAVIFEPCTSGGWFGKYELLNNVFIELVLNRRSTLRTSLVFTQNTSSQLHSDVLLHFIFF